MKRDRKRHGVLTCTSGTTTWRECAMALLHRKDRKDYIEGYHKAIRKVFGVSHAYSFCSGRASLYALLKAMGTGEGSDEVVLTGYTCVAVPKAVMYAGASPVYADIDERDFGVTLETVKRCITERTRAVVVQHTYGIPCEDVFKIRDYCHERGIYMIEDCAHVTGTKYQGVRLGCIGDAAFFSTDHGKYISTSVGGFAITDDAKIGDALRNIYGKTPALSRKEQKAIVSQFITTNWLNGRWVAGMVDRHKHLAWLANAFTYVRRKLKRSYFLDDYTNFDWPQYTFPGRLPNAMALIGQSQLHGLKENTGHRKKITDIYREKLNRLVSVPGHCKAPGRVPLLVADPGRFARELSDIVRVGMWFSNTIMCIPESLNRAAYYEKGSCAVAEHATRHIVNLPTHLKVTEEDAIRICERILSMDRDIFLEGARPWE